MERGRKKMAPDDGDSFRPLFLSFSLWRRDSGPAVSAEASVSATSKARCLPPSLSPRKERTKADRREVIPWRGVERKWRRVNLAIPSPLPVLLPLEKGPGPGRFGRDERLRNKQSTLPTPPSLSPRKGRPKADWREVILWRGVERPQHQASVPLPIYPPCPLVSSVLGGGQVWSYSRPMPRRPGTDGGGNPQARSVPSE